MSDITVPGFTSGAIAAGIKAGGTKDLTLIFSEVPASAAGLFTTNRIKAAPVILSMNRIKKGFCQALLVNSGCANACTGEQGKRDAEQMCRWAAEALGIDEELVLIASTGVIGEPLPMRRIKEGINKLASELNPTGFGEAAEAIMTTDTHPKMDETKLIIEDKEVSIAGIAKGAGMLHPKMATMLCFVLTDAVIQAPLLRELTSDAMDRSFHAITVDGDTSTNDTIIALANGRAGHRELDSDHSDLPTFKGHLDSLLRSLAIACVEDAEGATKFIEIRVEGAKDLAEAKQIGLSVANSPLVKTAFFGEEVNWGRIMAAIGCSDVSVAPERVDIWYGKVKVVSDGVGTGKAQENLAAPVLRERNIKIIIDIKRGIHGFSVYTSDLSLDYVKINASYKS